MIIFAQLCYCIYYENYYNSFIMKNKKNNFYLMGVVFIAILGGLLFGYDTAVISGAEQALQKHLGLDAFWTWRDCFQCIDRLRHWQCFFRLFCFGARTS